MNLVHGHGTKKSSKGGKKHATEMHISKAKNGFSVRTHHEPSKAGGKKGGPLGMSMGYEPPEESVYPDHNSMLQHVASSFGAPDGSVAPPPGQSVPASGAPQASAAPPVAPPAGAQEDED